MAVPNIRGIVDSIKDISVKDLLQLYNIYTEYTESFTNKKQDALLIIQNDIRTIFIKNGLSPEYEYFIILHELGHFLLHTGITSFAFRQKIYKTKIEREANLFAVLYLLNEVELNELEVISYLIGQGVPQNIACQSFETLSVT